MKSVTFQGRPSQMAQKPIHQQQKPVLNTPAQQQESKKASEPQVDRFVRFGCSSC
jgi:hypothetical protein